MSERMPEKAGVHETPQQIFEREVVEPTREIMVEAMSHATSEKEAEQKITDALPKGRFFLGPLVMYREIGEGEEKQRNIIASVLTLDTQKNQVTIKAQFVG